MHGNVAQFSRAFQFAQHFHAVDVRQDEIKQNPGRAIFRRQLKAVAPGQRD